MPELPEVETVTRQIRPRFEGRRIEACEVRWARTLGGQSPASFTRAVVGARVSRVWRRAKYVIADLERGGAPAGALVGHLRMTGRMQVDEGGAAADESAERFLKVALELDDGRVFRFIDVRKFGRLQFVERSESLLGKLGPEPLSSEFTRASLHAGLRARRRRIKPLLLDQEFVAGLGNIYVDEALFRSRIHPLARSDRVDARRAGELWRAIRNVLSEAIEREGSSFDVFYRTPEGRPGSYQDRFRVYGRAGKPCTRCREPITRSVVGQRGTHFCARCQKR